MMIGTLKNLNFEEDNFYFHDYKIKNISKTKNYMILELGDISISFIKTINETSKNPKNFLKEKYILSFENVEQEYVSFLIKKINSSLFQVIDSSLKKEKNRFLVFFKLFDINNSTFEEIK